MIIIYSQELTQGTSGASSTLTALKEIFDDEEFLEITFVIATANLFNRLADGLAVKLEPEYARPAKI